MYTPLQLQQLAQENYENAIRKANRRRLVSLVLRKRNSLLSLDKIARCFKLVGQRSLGVMTVEIEKIVGSAGRAEDFDLAWMPRQTTTMARWMSIIKAAYLGVMLPPVELRKVGERYFVVDGHHRISVAREMGQQYIDAQVTEMDFAGLDPYDSAILVR